MHPFVWLGVVLLVAWGVLWLGLNIVSGAIHLLLLVGAVLLVWGFLKRGARAVGRHM